MNSETLTPTRRTLLVPLTVSAAVLVALYGWFPYSFGYGLVPVPVFRVLQQMWTSAELGDWGHCPFVPLVVLFLIWWEHKKLASTPIENNGATGTIAIVSAGLFFWIGYKVDLSVIGFLSIQVTLAALIIWFFGLKFMRAVFFPWAFLIFAWPMPFINTNKLSLVIAKISALLLNIVGMDCVQSGVKILSAPHPEYGLQIGRLFSLEVAAACSGLRSLFALMMMAALGGYLLLEKPWQRWILFFCSVPLAMTGNVFRVILLAFGVQVLGSETAIGSEENPSFYHLFAGFMVFVIALGGMFATGWLLSGGWRTVARICGMKKPA
ncbi:MAG: exosortase/archaeosortase family protein [Verrucomicrobiales bacterium]|jgi:exosortase|nr:exosortase/archaeosortase family protein [Verrucomicrobiales bacterium]